jgi:hypothetical protein
MPFFTDNGLIISPTPKPSGHTNPHKAKRALLDSLAGKWFSKRQHKSDDAAESIVDATIEFYPQTLTDPKYQYETLVIETCAPQRWRDRAEESEKDIKIMRYCHAEDEVSLWSAATNETERRALSVGNFVCKLVFSFAQDSEALDGWTSCTAEAVYPRFSAAESTEDRLLRYGFDFDGTELCGIHIERGSNDGDLRVIEYGRKSDGSIPREETGEKHGSAIPVSRLTWDRSETRLHHVGGNCCPRQLYDWSV